MARRVPRCRNGAHGDKDSRRPIERGNDRPRIGPCRTRARAATGRPHCASRATSVMTMRIMTDSNVFDFIVADPVLHARVEETSKHGDLVLLTTHVQEDELAAVGDTAKAMAIATIPRQRIPTMGFVLDVSRLDEARLSEPGTIEALRRDNW